jgi:hypothetical protein
VYSFFDLHKKGRMSEEEQNLEENIGKCAFKIGISLLILAGYYSVKFVKHRTKVKCLHPRTPDRSHPVLYVHYFPQSPNLVHMFAIKYILCYHYKLLLSIQICGICLAIV